MTLHVTDSGIISFLIFKRSLTKLQIHFNEGRKYNAEDSGPSDMFSRWSILGEKEDLWAVDDG